MNIPLTVTVAASRPFEFSKDGYSKRLVKIQGSAVGLGIFEFLVDEKKVPDNLEGTTCKAIFELYIDRNFKIGVRFKGFDGYAA